MAESPEELLRALRRTLGAALQVSAAAQTSVDPETGRRISTLVIHINAVLEAMDRAEQPPDPDAHVTALSLSRETGVPLQRVIGLIGRDKEIIVQRARTTGPHSEPALYHRQRALNRIHEAEEERQQQA